jgi:hypothetical protein
MKTEKLIAPNNENIEPAQLAEGQEPRVTGRFERTPDNLLETRSIPGELLDLEADEEDNISGSHGGPKLPK